MSRVLPPRPDEMTEAQQAMYDGIVHGPRTPKGGRSPYIDDEGRLIGPFGIWNIAPNVGDAVQNVGVAVRYNTSLKARVREIAILAVGAAYRANFEWYAHAPLAAATGVSAEQLERLRQGADPEGFSEEERLAVRLARELIDDRAASEATMQAVIATFGKETSVELVILIGYYAMLCITLNAFDVDLPPGEEKPFG